MVRRRLILCSVLCYALGLSGTARAQVSAQVQDFPGMVELRKEFPEGAIVSPTLAAHAKARVGVVRNQVEQEYSRRKNACYSNFFATSCTDRIGVNYRSAKSDLRRIEGEAEAFEHHYAAEQKEKEIAQRRLEDAAKQPQRIAKVKQQAEKKSTHADAQQKKTGQQQQRAVETQKKQKEKQIKQTTKRKDNQQRAETLTDQQQKYQEKRKKIEAQIRERDQRLEDKKKNTE